MKTELIVFEGKELICPLVDGTPYCAVLPIIEGVGLNPKSAIPNLKRHPRLGGLVKHLQVKRVHRTVDSFEKENGVNALNSTPQKIEEILKGQYLACLPVNRIAAWLYNINPNKVKPEIRQKLIRYQDQCDQVLYNHFFGKGEQLARFDVEMKGLMQEKAALAQRLAEALERLRSTPAFNEVEEIRKEKRAVKLKIQQLLAESYGQLALFEDGEEGDHDPESAIRTVNLSNLN